MVLNFTIEELSFIAKQFKYDHLEGVAFVRFNKAECIDSLVTKNYLIPYGKKFELSNDVRLLLSTWDSVRYTLLQDKFANQEHVFAIMANSKRIISYSSHGNDIQLSMCDFSVEVMDKVITDYLGIENFGDCPAKFNITFSADEFLSYFKEDVSNDVICGKTGLSDGDVSLIKYAIKSDEGISYIVQDVVEDIGCMGNIVKYPEGYVLIKHVVPNRNVRKQKVIITKGDAQDIVDSIYIL